MVHPNGASTALLSRGALALWEDAACADRDPSGAWLLPALVFRRAWRAGAGYLGGVFQADWRASIVAAQP